MKGRRTMELLRRLCEADGISGQEDGIVEIFREELKDYTDSKGKALSVLKDLAMAYHPEAI